MSKIRPTFGSLEYVRSRSIQVTGLIETEKIVLPTVGDIGTVLTNINSSINTINNQIVDISNAALDELDDRLDILRNQYDTMNSEITNIKSILLDFDERFRRIENRIDTMETIIDSRNEFDDNRIRPIETTTQRLSKFIAMFSSTYHMVDISNNPVQYPITNFDNYTISGLDSNGYLIQDDNQYENPFPTDISDFPVTTLENITISGDLSGTYLNQN